MPESPRWDRDVHDAILRELHAEGLGCNDVARRMGFTGQTVSRHGKRIGLDWSRVHETRAAVMTNKLSNMEKRTLLEADLWDEARTFLGRLHQPHVAFSFGGRDNTYNEQQMDRPDVTAALSIMRSLAIAVDKAARIAEINTAAKDMSDVDLWLSTMAGERDDHTVEPENIDTRGAARRPLTTT